MAHSARCHLRAQVVTPFVSTDALSRMCSEANLTHIDHVLLEWWLTITLFKDKDSPLKAVLPVFRGNIGVERDGRPFVGNLFASFKKVCARPRVTLTCSWPCSRL